MEFGFGMLMEPTEPDPTSDVVTWKGRGSFANVREAKGRIATFSERLYFTWGQWYLPSSSHRLLKVSGKKNRQTKNYGTTGYSHMKK